MVPQDVPSQNFDTVHKAAEICLFSCKRPAVHYSGSNPSKRHGHQDHSVALTGPGECANACSHASRFHCLAKKVKTTSRHSRKRTLAVCEDAGLIHICIHLRPHINQNYRSRTCSRHANGDTSPGFTSSREGTLLCSGLRVAMSRPCVMPTA